MKPLVSVVMPVFNGEAYLADAMGSILNQTVNDLELIVIDDGSIDGSAAVARRFDDPRVRLLQNDGNRGLVHSRNRGLDSARGQYLAFLDADDIALPRRLERQLSVLEREPHLMAVGSAAQPITAQGQRRGRPWRMRGDAAFCRAMLLFRQWFVTSTLVVRTQALKNFRFSDAAPLAEDMDLYSRMAPTCPMRNLDEVLCMYRLHGKNTTQTRRAELRVALTAIHQRSLAALGLLASPEDLALHLSLEWHDQPADTAWLLRVEHWLHRIAEANRNSGLYGTASFAEVLSEVWLGACEQASRTAQRQALARFAQSSLSQWRGTAFTRVAKLAVRPWLAARP